MSSTHHSTESASLVLQLHESARKLDASTWDQLLAGQTHPTPFMRHAYLAAMESSGSACAATGWAPVFFTLHREGEDALLAACVLYVKNHSRGEYVFDWAWADAYERHGLSYYPKAVLSVPFTPVPGSRLLARDAASRAALLKALISWASEVELSSLHMLFAADDDVAAARDAGLMLRHTVQFHWQNRHPHENRAFVDFDDFLASLNQEKRKKIRQERRRVQEAGVSFRTLQGAQITRTDWDFFYACYERTYIEHGNPPYLTRDFFHSMQTDMPENWLLCIAERDARPMAASLIALDADGPSRTAYGRYWGAMERVDSLHFEACYYQPLEWCIAHGIERFEGGAQGEHKMARALMPIQATSAHWLAHPAFAEAVQRFLEREGQGVEHYMEHLQERSPFRHPQ